MHIWVIKARALARKTGVIGLFNRVMRSHDAGEQRVHAAMIGAVRPGDVVWDVGANVGMYSELFCGLVGKDGTVVAFEPFPESCQSIRERLPDCQWLRVECVALSDVDTQGMLAMGDQSVQHHIATEAESAGATTASVPVVICRADTLSQRLGQVPNVIKVDVEGFEEEVLNGMGDLLTSSRLRSILTEVHFAKLEKRGRLTAPNRIETLLKKNGFTTKWVDSSHLLATR